MNELIAEHELEEKLAAAIDLTNGKSHHDESRPSVGRAGVYADADTSKSTRSMKEQMMKIIASLENDIAEAMAIRRIITHRIDDMTLALNASKAAFDTVQNMPSS